MLLLNNVVQLTYFYFFILSIKLRWYFSFDKTKKITPSISSESIDFPRTLTNVKYLNLKNVCEKYFYEFLTWERRQPSKHKTFLEHLYNVGPTSSTLVQHYKFYTNVLCLLRDRGGGHIIAQSMSRIRVVQKWLTRNAGLFQHPGSPPWEGWGMWSPNKAIGIRLRDASR